MAVVNAVIAVYSRYSHRNGQATNLVIATVVRTVKTAVIVVVTGAMTDKTVVTVVAMAVTAIAANILAVADAVFIL